MDKVLYYLKNAIPLFFKNEGSSQQPIVVNKLTLQSMSTNNSIIVCKWPKPLRFRYYRNLLPGFLVTNCENCNKVSTNIFLQTLTIGK